MRASTAAAFGALVAVLLLAAAAQAQERTRLPSVRLGAQALTTEDGTVVAQIADTRVALALTALAGGSTPAPSATPAPPTATHTAVPAATWTPPANTPGAVVNTPTGTPWTATPTRTPGAPTGTATAAAGGVLRLTADVPADYVCASAGYVDVAVTAYQMGGAPPIAGAPASITGRWNGDHLATAQGTTGADGKHTARFAVSASWYRPTGDNRLSFAGAAVLNGVQTETSWLNLHLISGGPLCS